jgi:cobalt-zinc-cadmium efflux system protein
MRSDKRILLAFLLNLGFSLFEFVGGLITGSVAILSDALHDLGDAAGIGVSLFLERKSKRKADDAYTYGYARYSMLGSVFTMLILLTGSVAVIWNAAQRLLHPTPIHYGGMILFALVGVAVNLIAALVTRGGESMNQKAVSLHMLEDVLGWVVVLVGAVVMRFTDLWFLDSLMSIGVALFIGIHAAKGLLETLPYFLEKAPQNVDVPSIKVHLAEIPGVLDVHHIHLWSMDERHNCATMHIVTNGDPHEIKAAVRHELSHHGINHATLELETEGEECPAGHCHVTLDECESHHHHHHHHH